MLHTLLSSRGCCCLSHGPLRAASSHLGGPNPAQLSAISLILLQTKAVKVGVKKREGSGGSKEEKQWPLVQAPAGSELRRAPMVVLGALPG